MPLSICQLYPLLKLFSETVSITLINNVWKHQCLISLSSRLFNKIHCCSVSLIWTLAQTFYLYFNTLFCLNVSIIPNMSLNFCVWLNARCWEQLYFWFQMLLYYRVLVWFHYLFLVTEVAIDLFHFCSKLKKLSEDSLTKQPEEVFDVLEKLGEG